MKIKIFNREICVCALLATNSICAESGAEMRLKMPELSLPHDHGQNIRKALGRLPQQEQCAQVAEVFKQVSDGTRLRVFWLLCHCEECVSNIAAAMGMSDPAVSHHLRILKKGGLITSRRDGKEIYYKLADTKQARLLHLACEEMFEIACPLK